MLVAVTFSGKGCEGGERLNVGARLTHGEKGKVFEYRRHCDLKLFRIRRRFVGENESVVKKTSVW